MEDGVSLCIKLHLIFLASNDHHSKMRAALVVVVVSVLLLLCEAKPLLTKVWVSDKPPFHASVSATSRNVNNHKYLSSISEIEFDAEDIYLATDGSIPCTRVIPVPDDMVGQMYSEDWKMTCQRDRYDHIQFDPSSASSRLPSVVTMTCTPTSILEAHWHFQRVQCTGKTFDTCHPVFAYKEPEPVMDDYQTIPPAPQAQKPSGFDIVFNTRPNTWYEALFVYAMAMFIVFRAVCYFFPLRVQVARPRISEEKLTAAEAGMVVLKEFMNNGKTSLADNDKHTLSQVVAAVERLVDDVKQKKE